MSPQRYRADGPPVAAAAHGGYRTPEVPLLTHDDSDPTALVANQGGIAVAERTRTEARRGTAAPRKRVSRWRRVRRWLFVVLGLALLGPFVAFVVGWLIFPVPSSQEVALSQVATFTFADGAPLATVRPDNVNRVNVSLDRVPEHVREAVLAAEDRSFYSNPGFDFMGIGRAVFNQLTGRVGGGSTITQQYVKVSTGQDDFSLARKYKEVILAVKISREKTKDEILENYLNTIYFGRGAYGIQAAAQAYFGKDVRDLTLSEGAMIAGIIQAPSRWDPAENPERSEERWNFVLDGMAGQNWITAAERSGQTFPDNWLPEPPPSGGVPDDDRYHIYERAVEELADRGISQEQINTEGLTVTTTVQQPLQAEAVDAIKEQMRREPDNLRSSVVSIDPKTGAILAYYGGLNGLGTDYAMAFRQPGSSFKPFVLSAALQSSKGIGLGTMYPGTSPMSFPGRPAVRNVEGVSCDRCNVVKAMTDSINTIFYQMGLQIGPDRVAEAAHQAGIPAEMLPDPTGGISLGDKEVHPVDMASAYATFAADGVYHEPFIVSRVEAADGRVLYDRTDSPGRQAVPQQVARNVTESMLKVAPKKNLGLAGGRPVAAKSGTVQLEGSASDNKDAWFVGYTPSISTAVWLGSDRSDPLRDAQNRPIFGSNLPAKIWHQFMDSAVRGQPVEQFSRFVPIGEPPGAEEPVSPATDEDSEDGSTDEDDEDSNSDEDGSSGSGDSSDEDSSSSNDSFGSGDDDSGSGSGNGNGRSGGGGRGGGNGQSSGSGQDSVLGSDSGSGE